MKTLSVTLTAMLFVVVELAGATEPAPIPRKAKLRKAAELVVVGDVLRVEPFGTAFTGRCNVWQYYRASVAVRSTLKGRASSTVVKVKFLRKVRGLIRCRPLHTELALTAGKRYEFYLVEHKLKYGSVYGVVSGDGVFEVEKK